MTKFDEIKNKTSDIIAEHERLMQEFSNAMKTNLQNIFDAFFESFPQVKTIHWLQYTPYFNDGDPCEFNLHEVYFSSTEYNELESAYGEDDSGDIEEKVWDSATKSYVEKELPAGLGNAMRFIIQIMNKESMLPVLQSAYGDHVWVKLYSGGVSVDDYDHD